MPTEPASPIRLADYRPTDYLIDHVDLDVSLDPNATRVVSTLSVRPNPKGVAGAPLKLDGDELEFVSVSLDNAPLDAAAYTAGPQGLTLAAPPQRPFALRIETRIAPAANTKLMGLFRSRATYCTQCEPEGFRRITYFLDRPDVLSLYRTRIEADKAEAPVLLGNGNPIASGDIPGTNRHFAVWDDPFPKPSYLFAMVGGALDLLPDTFRTMSGRDVTLGIYVEPGKRERALYAMDSLKRSMAWDEKVFGREYDLDIFNIVAVSDFNMGAMENKGLNVFNDKYVLASPETATDFDYAGIEAVIAHEYFHNWTGDRITCRDWFQLCLKEGLTVFRDQEFSSDERSRPVKRISDVRDLRASQFVEDAGPLAHPVRPEIYHEINNFYTATVYNKGAELVRMIKVLLGPEGFRKGMDLYFERHDGEAATVEDFIKSFEDANGADLTQFKRWYSQAGTPEVTVASRYDQAAQVLTVELSQETKPTPGQPTKEPQVIPLAIGLVGPDGSDMPFGREAGDTDKGAVIVLDKAAETIRFTHLPQRPVLSIGRGFSAPVNIRSDIDETDLVFLAGHDGDPFSRWQALQTLAMRRLVAAARDKGAPHAGEVVAALGAALADPTLDDAFLALMLGMPSEGDIAREVATDVDPDAIYAARTALRRAIAAAHGGRLEALYAEKAGGAVYSPDAVSAGRRALRNACLDLLATRGEAADITRAARQYEGAGNMTDRMAALTSLVLWGGAAADGPLADFQARFAEDALVIDKWFALQATKPGAGTLERVQALMAHPAFDAGNPNRMRSLVGSFAMANPTGFNRPDGAGYRFVGETMGALDRSNPQVAARILTGFRSWRMLEPGRRALAEAALERLAATPGLSSDVRDIVGRTLGKPTHQAA